MENSIQVFGAKNYALLQYLFQRFCGFYSTTSIFTGSYLKESNLFLLRMKFNLKTIILFAQDVDKLKTFYVDIFNLDIVEEIESEWLLLQAGNCRIGIHKIGEQYLLSHQEESTSENNTKLVFEVDEDIFEIREKLLRQNVFIREIKTFENYDFWLCDGTDPEGNVFQLNQRKDS